MKIKLRNKLAGLLLIVSVVTAQAQTNCKEEINYSISNVVVNGGAVPFISNDDGSAQITVGQSYAGSSGSFNQGISSRTGFWGHYQLEPQAPRSSASEGEYVDRIDVEWDVVDDRKGPVVTGETTKIFRNGRLLTSVPISQTSYVDFNVFPGEFYTYEIVTTNALGDAKPIQAVGFLQPNGRITGKVETRTGAPVVDVKVVTTPNLGRSLSLDGTDDYAYFIDQAYQLNDYYTIEGWWRNVGVKNQTIFVAVDSGTTTPVVKISLDDQGKLHYYHDGNVDGTGIELVSKDGYNLDNFSRKWHHFAAVYDTAAVYLYVNGNRVAEGSPENPITDVVELEIGKDGPKLYSGYYSGFLDDLRIWDVGRERAELRKYKDITLTGEEEYLKTYWKFDEQFGNKFFDFADINVEDREHGYLCDVTRSDFISPAQLGAYTDEGGDYLIKGVFYGSGTTFSVAPIKETSIGYSLDFDGTDDFISYQLDRQTYENEFTLEGWIKTAASGTEMVLFEATNPEATQMYLQLGLLATGEFFATSAFSGTASTITSTAQYNDEFWYHYALTHDGTTTRLYIDGQEVGTGSDAFSTAIETRMVIGRSDPIESNAGSKYFNGSLDEIRLWKEARTSNEVNATLNQIVPANEQGIVEDERVEAYWMLNEGQGSSILDNTPNGHTGELKNFQETEITTDVFIVSNWNGDDIPLDVEYFIHDFDPNARNASLDPSNTAVDRVDFTDISQIGISGFVKFSDANCFAPNIEIKINGSSFLPPVFTDENGKFIVELEPGTSSAFLIAESEDYVMDPGFIELPRLVRPIAGVKFEITTKRTLKGIVAGGECLYATGTANVRLRANDGCFEITVPIDASSGVFTADNLPPYNYQVSVVEHQNTQIQSSFDTKGAITVDLRQENDSVSFIYTSATEVALAFENTEANDCGYQVNNKDALLLIQDSEYVLEARLFQVYGIDTCYLQSGKVYIEDQVSNFSKRDTISIINGDANYTFSAGVPNLASPYQKSISVVGEDENGDQANGFIEVIVLGYKTLTSTFETTSPELPLFILRDPPGDESFSFLEQNEEICNTFSFSRRASSGTTFTNDISMGTDIEFGTGLGFVKTTKIDLTLDMNFEASATNSSGKVVENETCIASTETFTTSVNDLLSNGEGNVFVGGAFNVLVGTNRILSIVDCQVVLNDEVMILPTSFATTYIYTQQFIENSVIPGLVEINKTESAQQWERILAYNKSLEDNAQFSENISFSAGVGYEKSVTATETAGTTLELTSSFASQIGVETGIEVDGVGFTLGLSGESSNEQGYSKTSNKSTSKTVGYSLSDDDIGDSFTIDIKTDAQGMPVFDLIAGESMCPWEPGTRTRAAVGITPVSATSLVEVPEDEPAVFRVKVSNLAESAEDQFYELRVLQETNPNGATILLNGQEESVDLFIPANTSKEVVVTVEKGPDSFVFNDLEIEVNVPCELERAEALGIDINDLIAGTDSRNTFFARQKLSVEFVKTCQDLTVFSPGDSWLVNVEDNNQIPVTISDIDLAQTEFDQFKFQYRKTVEGEPFVVAETITRANLSGDSYSFDWDVNGVEDGQYELRVISECNSGFLPGSSELTAGRIDRQAPAVLGTPEPIDAVLGPNDEIFIVFNENINCDALISLGVAVSLQTGNVNNVGLFNSETGLAIEKTISCVDNKLVIVPAIQNKFIEEQTLRVDLLGVQDLYGNAQTDMITWEFLVRRNPLTWIGGDIQSVTYEGESPTFVRQIKNNGAFSVNVNLSGALDVQTLNETLLPSWISATPRSFSLQPGGTQDVTFTVSDQIGGGSYEDVVTAATSFGAPELRFDVRVLCPEPNWNINPSAFENSMNFTGQLDIRGEMSTDEYDIVAAFVGDELRGVGEVVYTPELTNIPGEHPYLVFMTLYTNNTLSEMIDFQVWDASRCQLYGQVAESYEISLNTVALGSPTDPKTITVTNDIIQKVPLSAGWNWISFNLNASSRSTSLLLNSLDNSRGDIVKSQEAFSQYVPSLGWVGPLTKLDSTQSFRIKLSQKDTLELVGSPIDFETTFIELDSGWNWVSFLPSVGMEINEALSNVTATADFIIKSQRDFAQYVEQQGWIGSLDFLRPNEGYLLYTDRAASLRYPVNSNNARIEAVADEPQVNLPNGWRLIAENYEFTSNIILSTEGIDAVEGDLIGIFNGEGLIGFGVAQYVDFMDKYYFFITTYANSIKEGDLTIKFHRNGEELVAENSTNFELDKIIGSVTEPFVAHFHGYVLTNQPAFKQTVSIYPNPVIDHFMLDIQLTQSAETVVTIHNLTGQVLYEVFKGNLTPGTHSIIVDKNAPSTLLNSGIYLLQVKTNGEVQTLKILAK